MMRDLPPFRADHVGSILRTAPLKEARAKKAAGQIDAAALKAVEDGMCAVIGLQSTGEASMSQVRDVLGDSMDDFVSAPRQVLPGSA